jgi:hypothetical protein
VEGKKIMESKLQEEINDWLRNNDIMYYHRQKGAYHKPKSQNFTTRIVNGKKVKCKHPDLNVYPFAKIVIFIELKTPTGKLSEEQENFQDWANEKGHTFYVCRSFVEFLGIMFKEGVV